MTSFRVYLQCNRDIATRASHSLAEFYSTLTRLPVPDRATPSQTFQFLESISIRFRLVSLESEDYLACIREAADHSIAGGTIYDALIARCAIQAGANRIFTWNTRHYQLLGPLVSKRIITSDVAAASL